MRSLVLLSAVLTLASCSKKSSSDDAEAKDVRMTQPLPDYDEPEEDLEPEAPVPQAVFEVAAKSDEEFELGKADAERVLHKLPLPGLAIYNVSSKLYPSTMACFATDKTPPACEKGAFALAVSRYELGKNPEKLTDEQWIELVAKAFQLHLLETPAEALELEVPADVAAKVTPSRVERKQPLVVRATYLQAGGLSRDAHPGVRFAVATIDAGNKISIRFDWPE